MTFGKDAPPLPMYEHVVLKHVPTMVRRRYDRDLLKFDDLPNKDQDRKRKDDEPEEDAHAAAASDVDDCIDVPHSNLDSEQEQNAPTYTEDFDTKNYGSTAKDSKSKSGGAEDANQDIIEDNGHAKYDSQHEAIKIEGDGTKHFLLDNEHENIDNEQGLHVEHCQNEGGGAKDANVTTNHVESSVNDEVLGSEDKKQGTKTNYENFEKLNVDLIHATQPEDGNVASYYVADGVKDENQEMEDENFNIKQGMYVEHGKSEGGIKDANVPCNINVDNSFEGAVQGKNNGNFENKIQDASDKLLRVRDQELKISNNKNDDFCPEAFKETLEQDGYELCCPNCKRYITQTMIYRRRGNGQHKTCCSFLIALFSCIR